LRRLKDAENLKLRFVTIPASRPYSDLTIEMFWVETRDADCCCVFHHGHWWHL